MLSVRTKYGYLVEQGLVSEPDLLRANNEALSGKGDIEQVLIKRHHISKQRIGEALSHFYHTRFVPFDPTIAVPRGLLRNLKPNYLRMNGWVPLGMNGSQITVVMEDPNHLIERDSVQTLLQSHNIEYCVGLREDILAYIDYFFSIPGHGETIERIMSRLTVEEPAPEEPLSANTVTSPMPIERDALSGLLLRLLSDAKEQGATSIHIEPSQDGVAIRFRIDGTCVPYTTLPVEQHETIIGRIKTLAHLDPAGMLLQQGTLRISQIDPSREEQLRVLTIPTVGGVEDVVLHMISPLRKMPLGEMGLSERNLRVLRRLLAMPDGLLLCVGPTGAGKTTTLHGALAELNLPGRKIWTIEDRVEIFQPGLRQVELIRLKGLGSAGALRSLMHADANVIMVGEIRDEQTGAAAIEASLGGHLILGGMCAPGAPETLTRFLDMSIDPFGFSDALLGVLAQRLVRTLCETCRSAYHPEEAEFQEIVREYGPADLERMGITYSGDLTLMKRVGCSECHHTGYRGRIAIHELIECGEVLRRLIQRKRPTDQLREQAARDGMTTLRQDGLAKVFSGLTDIDEVRAACVR